MQVVVNETFQKTGRKIRNLTNDFGHAFNITISRAKNNVEISIKEIEGKIKSKFQELQNLFNFDLKKSTETDDKF